MVWLDNARIIAIFAVVLLHCAAGVVSMSPFGSQSWWVGNLYDALVRWCVPVFVMISGALLLDTAKNDSIKTFYIKRMSRILIPILFWSAFFLLYTDLIAIAEGSALQIDDFLEMIIHGVPYYHMWFLYMILSLYLFTPFFRKMIVVLSEKEINLLIFLLFLFSAINSLAAKFGLVDSKLFVNWFLSYLPYYFLGYFIRTSDRCGSKRFWIGLFCIAVVPTILGYYFFAKNGIIEASLYIYDYLSITVILMSISIFYLLKGITKPFINKNVTRTTASLTLGVYLVHPLILEPIQNSRYGPLEFNQWISIPVMAVVVFLCSLGAAWAIKRIPYLNRVI